MPIGIKNRPGAYGLAPTFDPDPADLINPTQAIEIRVGGNLDSTWVNNTTVLLKDLVTGYSYTPTVTYIKGSSTAGRIIITPDRIHEFNHRIRVETTKDLKDTNGNSYPKILQDFTVQAAPKTQLVYDPEYFDLIIARIKANINPWKTGYNDSNVNNGRYFGVFNDDEWGADDFQSKTPDPFIGNPSDIDEFLTAYRQMYKEMYGCKNSIFAYYVTGED